MTTFSENDIRPVDLVAGKKAAFESDLAWFLSKQARFQPAPCPACGATAGDVRWTKFGLTFMECKGCGTTYMSPRPSQSDLGKLV